MAKGIKRELKAAYEAARREIAALSASGGHFARGLSSEGYMGGYAQALDDVTLALNGVEPDRWRRWRIQQQGKATQWQQIQPQGKETQ